jgi:hypothetical protein
MKIKTGKSEALLPAFVPYKGANIIPALAVSAGGAFRPNTRKAGADIVENAQNELKKPEESRQLY